MSTVTGKQAAQVAAAEPEFDPTLDSWQINYARLMSHVSQVSRGGEAFVFALGSVAMLSENSC